MPDFYHIMHIEIKLIFMFGMMEHVCQRYFYTFSNSINFLLEEINLNELDRIISDQYNI